MRTATSRIGLALALMMGLSGSLQAQDDETSLYSIILPQFPVIGTCDQASTYAAKAFTQRTNLPVVRYECHVNQTIFGHEGPLDYGIKLFYRATRRLKIVAIGEPSSQDMETLGSYNSKEACLADQNHQTELFRKATGIQPVFAYCFNNRWITSNGWTYHAQGYGIPQSYPHLYAYNIGMGPGREQESAIISAVQRGFESKGAVVMNTFFRYDAITETRTLNVRYFSISIVGIYVYHVSSSDFRSCEAQKASILKAFKQSNFQPLTAICSGRYDGNIELNFVTLAADWVFADDSLPFTYNSYNECFADLNHAMLQYHAPEGYTINGAFCDGSTSTSRIKILLSPKPGSEM